MGVHQSIIVAWVVKETQISGNGFLQGGKTRDLPGGITAKNSSSNEVGKIGERDFHEQYNLIFKTAFHAVFQGAWFLPQKS